MEHPGLDIKQIKRDLTLEDIQEKIGQLNTRLSFAYRMNNQAMTDQLAMMLEVYMRAQRELLDEMFSPDGDGKDMDGKIDIS